MSQPVDDLVLERLRRDPQMAILERAIICLTCGRPFRQITNTHLAKAHHTTTRRYKAKWGYNRGQALMSKAHRERYRARAIVRGLASTIRQRPILVRPELRAFGGIRTLRLQERLNRGYRVAG